MKAGDHTRCPHCGEDTFVKEEVVMDGWTVRGKILKCTLCGKKLADAPGKETAAAAATADSAKLSALSGLLGEKPVAQPSLGLRDGARHFCKDCGHFIIHPFMTHCSRFDREVDPMGDCPEFKARTANSDKDQS